MLAEKLYAIQLTAEDRGLIINKIDVDKETIQYSYKHIPNIIEKITVSFDDFIDRNHLRIPIYTLTVKVDQVKEFMNGDNPSPDDIDPYVETIVSPQVMKSYELHAHDINQAIVDATEQFLEVQYKNRHSKRDVINKYYGLTVKEEI